MINKNKLKKKKFVIVKNAECNAVSIVTAPAIESDFKLFSEIEELNESVKSFNINSEKMQITGPAMIPLKEMLRKDEETGELFMGYFDADTIESYVKSYFKAGNNRKVNFEHNQEDFTKKIFAFESWLISSEKSDKAYSLGFKDLPKGTWMITYQVEDESLWEEIKNGDFKGFSVEVKATTFSNISNIDLFEYELEEKIKWIMNSEQFDLLNKEVLIKQLMQGYK